MKKNNFLQKISEGDTKVFVYKNKMHEKGPGTKEKLPFYNPSMMLNRDLSIVFCQWLVNKSKKELKILDGLAASGIRGIRIANETDGDFKVFINDWNKESFELIQKNLKENQLENVEIYNKNLNTLLSEKKFDYIDVDPFGSPAYFIDSAMRSIKDGGVIACTATDTATLCGVYPKVCWRRYASMPFHSVCMKEVGLRILIGFICRVAGIYDKKIEPILSHVTDHYFRVYVRVKSGAKKANKSMQELKVINSGENIGFEETKKTVGPLWLGDIEDKEAVENIRNIVFEKKLGSGKKLWKLLDMLEEEADAPCFFYTSESISEYLKNSSPKLIKIFDKLKNSGFECCRTHFTPTGFKTNADFDVIEKTFKQN